MGQFKIIGFKFILWNTCCSLSFNKLWLALGEMGLGKKQILYHLNYHPAMWINDGDYFTAKLTQVHGQKYH